MTSHPVLTQSLTAGFLFGTGDVLAQQVIEQRIQKKEKVFQIRRTIQNVMFGLLLCGPAVSYWYRFLQTSVRFNSPIKSTPFPTILLIQRPIGSSGIGSRIVCTFILVRVLWISHFGG